jgi:AcrR family transcriptional regulator
MDPGWECQTSNFAQIGWPLPKLLNKGCSMSSLRLRQKQARSEQILEAARTLFLERGYSKTNMEAIAEAAEVGIATIYTYFDNKEGVVAAIIRKDVLELQKEAEELLNRLPKEPVDAVIALLGIYRKFDDYISYDMMRDFIIQAKVDGPVRETMHWTHIVQVDQVKRALEHGQKAGTVSRALACDDAACIVIDLLDRYVSRITSDSNRPKDAEALHRYIRVLFEPWRP